MDLERAHKLLRLTHDEVKDHFHENAYIQLHWWRFIHLLSLLPHISSGTKVLEVGASIISTLLRRRMKAEVHVIYHPIESYWKDRCRADGISCHPCELILDPLPFDEGFYDLIIFTEVLEHLPIHPDFLLKQLLGKLRPEGQLIFTTPNFALAEKRWQLLVGKNPQDPMDKKFIYYAHHREPVMGECLAMFEACGGTVTEYFWSDFQKPQSLRSIVWQSLKYPRYHKFHPVVRYFVPSTRKYIFIRVQRNPAFSMQPDEIAPPLSITNEYRCIR